MAIDRTRKHTHIHLFFGAVYRATKSRENIIQIGLTRQRPRRQSGVNRICMAAGRQSRVSVRHAACLCVDCICQTVCLLCLCTHNTIHMYKYRIHIRSVRIQCVFAELEMQMNIYWCSRRNILARRPFRTRQSVVVEEKGKHIHTARHTKQHARRVDACRTKQKRNKLIPHAATQRATKNGDALSI